MQSVMQLRGGPLHRCLTHEQAGALTWLYEDTGQADSMDFFITATYSAGSIWSCVTHARFRPWCPLSHLTRWQACNAWTSSLYEF